MRALFVVVVVTYAATASADRSAEEYDARARAELAALSPAALEAWDAANAVRRTDFKTSARRYLEVTELAPTFHHAWRRRCTALTYDGQHDAAVAACRKALELASPPENLAALASALATRRRDADYAEAAQLARRALATHPDAAVCEMLAVAAVKLGEPSLLGEIVDEMRARRPGAVETHYYGALLAAIHGQWDDADDLLERARAAGLPREMGAPLAKAIAANRPAWPRVLRLGGIVLATWLGALLVLLVAGAVLGRVTLRTAERAARDGTADATPAERRLRRVYAGIIGATSVYFYLSVPLLLALVVAAGGGLIYAFFALGQIPVKLVLLIGLVVLATVGAIVKSLFVRVADEDPGLRLELEREPKLRAALTEVAAKIGTAPVDNVYLTVGTDVAVTERGGMWRRLRGRTERCLILGVGVLDGMKLRELEAILGHEYGHLRNQDTAGGGFALAVRRSLWTMIVGLARGGAANWYHPAWWFVRGYHAVFERVSQGASRLQEILADRWATIAYGAEAFERGLRHVIERAIRFDAHASHAVNEVIERKLPLANLYRYQPQVPLPEEDAQEIAARIAAAIDREPSAYDSHPAPRQRFALVHALGAAGAGTVAIDDVEAWSLFADREALERRLTDEVRRNVAASSGHTIDAAAAA